MTSLFRYKQICLAALTLTLGANVFALRLKDYENPNPPCFDRSANSYLTVADTHIHFRPFAGPAIPFTDLRDEVRKNGVVFAAVMGIGQRSTNGAVDAASPSSSRSGNDGGFYITF